MASENGFSSVGGSSMAGGKNTGGVQNLLIRTGRTDNEDDDGDVLDSGQALRNVLFGALWLIQRERIKEDWRIVLLRLAVEWWQLIGILIHPYHGWDIDTSKRWWRALSFWNLSLIYSTRTYALYVKFFYIIGSIFLAASFVLIWLGWGFRQRRVKIKWPIKIMSLFFTVVLDIFGVTLLRLMEVGTECQYLGFSDASKMRLEAFPLRDCTETPTLIHMGVGWFMTIFVFGAGFFKSLSQVWLSPISRDIMAVNHSGVEMYTWCNKFAVTFFLIIFGWRKFQAVALFIIMTGQIIAFLRYVPHLNLFVNNVRAGTFATSFWVTGMSVLLVFRPSVPRDDVKIAEWRSHLTGIMLYGMIPAYFIGFFLCHLRVKLYMARVTKRFEEATPNMRPKDIFRFSSPHDVEIATRCVRKFPDEDTVDPDAIKLADSIVRTGLLLFQANAYMILLNANFHFDVLDNSSSANSQVQLAKKNPYRIIVRYLVFVREQEYLSSSTTSKTGETTLDLASYVEFQRNYRMALRAHKDAMYATRNFWQYVLHSTPSFMQMASSLSAIDKAVAKADKVYRLVLERYPQSIKLLKGYAKFLETVKQDPYKADKMYVEAEKEDSNRQDDGDGQQLQDSSEEGVKDRMLHKVDERLQAVVIINARGIIQVVNKKAYTLLGYNKGELEGKNVMLMMPPPFSQRHDSYLRNYLNTGEEHVMNRLNEVVALHKDRYVFFVRQVVTKVSGAGEDSVYMSVMELAPDQPGVCNVFALLTGSIAAVDLAFVEWFAIGLEDIVGQHIATLVDEQDQVRSVVDQIRAAVGDDALEMTLHVKHRYIASIEVMMTIRKIHAGSEVLLRAELRRTSHSRDMLLTDRRGKIKYITPDISYALNQSPSSLKNTFVQDLIPPPFASLHTSWLRGVNADQGGHPPPFGCRAGISVPIGLNPSLQKIIKLKVSTSEDTGEMEHYVDLFPSNVTLGMDERRLKLCVSPEGKVLEVLSNSPDSLFGFRGSTLLGRSLSDFIDVMRGEDVPSLLSLMLDNHIEEPGTSWRVGLTPPMSTSGEMSSVTAAILSRQTKAAVLTLELNVDMKAVTASGRVDIEISLWRAETISGVVEVDRQGTIVSIPDHPFLHAELLFGVSRRMLLRHPMDIFVRLEGRSAESLLTTGRATIKRSNSTKPGPLLALEGNHSDKETLELSLQAVSKDGPGYHSLLLLHALNPSRGVKNFRVVLQQLVQQATTAAADDVMVNEKNFRHGVSNVSNVSGPNDTKLFPMRSQSRLSNGTKPRAKSVKITLPESSFEPGHAHKSMRSPRQQNPPLGRQQTDNSLPEADESPVPPLQAAGIFRNPNVHKGSPRPSPTPDMDDAADADLPLVEKMIRMMPTRVSTPPFERKKSKPPVGGGSREGSGEGSGGSVPRVHTPPPQTLSLNPRAKRPAGLDNDTDLDDLQALIRDSPPSERDPDEDLDDELGGRAYMTPSPKAGRLSPARPVVRATIASGAGEGGSDGLNSVKDPSVTSAMNSDNAGMDLDSVNGGAGLKNAAQRQRPGAARPAIGSNSRSVLTFGDAEEEPTSRLLSEKMSPTLRTKLAKPRTPPNRDGDDPDRSVNTRSNAKLPGQADDDGMDDVIDSPRTNNTTKFDKIRLWVQSEGNMYYNSPYDEAATSSARPQEGDGLTTDGIKTEFKEGAPIKSYRSGDFSKEEEDEDEDDGVSRPTLDSKSLKSLLGESNADAASGAANYKDDDAASQGSAMSGVSGVSGTSDVTGAGSRADFRSAKRMKKIMRVFSQPEVVAVHENFQRSAIWGLAFVLFVDLVGFAVLEVMLTTQNEKLSELSSAGHAQKSLIQTLITSKYMSNLYAGIYADYLTPSMMSTLDSALVKDALELRTLHRSLYLGTGKKVRQISNAYFLNDLWNAFIANETIFYNGASEEVLNTMWSMGNDFLEGMLEIGHNHAIWTTRFASSASYVAATGSQSAWGAFNAVEGISGLNAWDYYRHVQYNGPYEIFKGYYEILDAMAFQAVDYKKRVIVAQLVLLVVEGCIIAVGVLFYVQRLLKSLEQQRYSLFSIFLLVPPGYVRMQASKAVAIDDDSDVEDDAEEEKDDPKHAAGAGGASAGRPALDGDASGPSTMVNLDAKVIEVGTQALLKASQAPAQKAIFGRLHSLNKSLRQPGGWQQLLNEIGGFLLQRLGFRNKVTPADGAPATKGTGRVEAMIRDSSDTMWLLAPFVVWTVLVISIRASCYMMVSQTDAAIAITNVINTVQAFNQRLILLTLNLASSKDVTTQQFFKDELAEQLAMLEVEWYVALYGANSTQRTLQHYKLASKGLAFLPGEDAGRKLLFASGEACYMPVSSMCYTPDNPYYQVVYNGLNFMMEHLVLEAGELLAMPFSNMTLDNSNVVYILNEGAGNTDGAIAKMVDLHLDYITSIYDKVSALYKVLFAMAWVLCISFLLLLVRPYLMRSRVELQRVAEMLTQLPSEVGIESIVMRVMTPGREIRKKKSAVGGSAEPGGPPFGGLSGGGGEGKGGFKG